MAIFIQKPWYKKGGGDDPTRIYGAEWTIASSPAWTRTDDAVGMSDPNPYYASMSGRPSSPFDTISPWKNMRIVEDSAAGTLVEIPKFYYKWTRTSTTMKLQISMTQHTGFLCSPAHANRGDGVGERDYAYVGRYHCASNFKSTTGVTPTSNLSMKRFRANIHDLGSNVWQNDFAMRWTVNMLYLVEFAHWNSQEKIGYGGGSGSIGNMGYTDNMGYHTGTTQTSKTTYGFGTQYRYIEGLWDNVRDWVEGIFFKKEKTVFNVWYNNIYCIINPSHFSSNTSDGVKIGSLYTNVLASGSIMGYTSPTTSGVEYALVPNSMDSSIGNNEYICDYCDYRESENYTVMLTMGGDTVYRGAGSLSYGLFYFGNNQLFTNSDSDCHLSIGSRLMVLPPSRLTA